MGMNCDDEKMAVISSTSTTNEWPQNNNNNVFHMISDDHRRKGLNTNNFNMASSTTAAPRTSTTTMDKPTQDHQQLQNQQQQQQQQALKCPRCDSSNTKFCYYNNYSLSQPRHFCKACKRYWTRGGTLRNVPVGGGCRKNKRVKRPSAANSSAVDVMPNSSSPNSSSSNLSAVINSHPSTTNSQHGQIDLSPGTSNHHHITSLFYNHDMSLPFSRFSTGASGYDHVALQPQLSSLGLGFSSSGNGVVGGDSTSTHQDTSYLSSLISSNSLLSSYSSIFGTIASTSSAAAASPTIASLLASKFANGGLKDHVLSGTRGLSHFQALAPFDELHAAGVSSGDEAGMSTALNNNKQVKLEDEPGIRAFDWINGGAASSCADPNQTDQIGLSSTISSDPSVYWTNPTAIGGANWHDPANIGSNSVPSLI